MGLTPNERIFNEAIRQMRRRKIICCQLVEKIKVYPEQCQLFTPGEYDMRVHLQDMRHQKELVTKLPLRGKGFDMEKKGKDF
jgi:hypothetical protein